MLAKTLFAVDELSGLILALAHVRPGNFEEMNPKSVSKAIKKKEFAKNISRKDIEQGIEELGVDKTEHFQILINVLSDKSSELGFNIRFK